MPIWFVILLILCAVILLAGWWWSKQNKAGCPHCGSLNIGEVSKKPVGLENYINPLGGETQLRYEVKYQCGDCMAGWQLTISEYQ